MPKELINTSLTEIKDLIRTAKQETAIAINTKLTLLYWQVGKRISDEILKGEHAGYGQNPHG